MTGAKNNFQKANTSNRCASEAKAKTQRESWKILIIFAIAMP